MLVSKWRRGIAMIKGLFALLTLAYIVWGAVALYIARDQQADETAFLITNADMPYCFTVKNQPLIGTHPTAVDPHPRMPDTA
jgi:hypothetical protein